ncbi:phosphoserine phosphatase SerB [Mariprofundus ferrinatatus]|uniref:Phosphoserine phosphatase n=1 Tax=Mariprofundus ferrinatatus TaxID=1921087 RepID=A0A2K8L233_9PROT|nr:phosphoserine phosphatase SerB [Mariprofundus ferrinatatus]ATX81347.1 phosphoserine phosphatase SerB [Mariprofundus ferrinatatus]
MLSNFLLPPDYELPIRLTSPLFATPGGGQLLLCSTHDAWRLRDHYGCDTLEAVQMQISLGEGKRLDIWQSELEAAHMNAHIFGCDSFEAFKEICESLALERIGILQVATQPDYCRLLLAGSADAKTMTMRLRPLSERLKVDIAVTDLKPSPSLSEPGLLLMDMDSTLIQCECIDEIADFMGIKDRIAAITQLSMEGKLDFVASFTERVKLLKGLDAGVLQRVLDERITLTEGAESLIRGLQAHGWKTGLVSGGFTFFTGHFEEKLGLDFSMGNELEIIGGKLTGGFIGDIVDASSKRTALLTKAKEWDIPMSQTIAIGDGANDLPMIEAAGMGIAFHAKPRVRELAPYALSYGGLNRALDLL